MLISKLPHRNNIFNSEQKFPSNSPHMAPLKEMDLFLRPHKATTMGSRVALSHLEGSITLPERTINANKLPFWHHNSTGIQTVSPLVVTSMVICSNHSAIYLIFTWYVCIQNPSINLLLLLHASKTHQYSSTSFTLFHSFGFMVSQKYGTI